MMFVRVFLLCLLAANAFACALCSTYSPTAHVQANFETNATAITGIKFTWTFSENFSNLLQTNYDLDADGNIDAKELTQIRRSLTDYIVPRHFLTTVEYYAQGKEATKLPLNVRDYDLKFDGGRLKFKIVFNARIPLEKDLVVSAELIDDEGYFAFKFLDESSQQLSTDLFAVPNLNANLAFYTLSDIYAAKEYDAKPSLKELATGGQEQISPDVEQTDKNKHAQIDAIDEAKFNAVARASVGFLDRLRELLKEGISSATGFILLLGVSFGYGFLHAAGAGHGKLLTAAYFAANGGSYLRAAGFALKIGFLHVIGAAVFVGAMFALLLAVSANYVRDAGRITTTASALIIIAVGAFMLYKKLRQNGGGVKFHVNLGAHKIYAPQNLALAKTAVNFAHESGCSCAACEFSAWQEAKMSSNVSLQIQNLQTRSNTRVKNGAHSWLIAAAAALVPCPGTILVFTLAYELGSFGAGLASGIAMALGMSAVIFVAAVFGAKINAEASQKFKSVKFQLELAAVVFMLALGLFILISNFTKASAF